MAARSAVDLRGARPGTPADDRWRAASHQAITPSLPTRKRPAAPQAPALDATDTGPYTTTRRTRSSPPRGEPRPSRFDVDTHSDPSGARTTVRIRPRPVRIGFNFIALVPFSRTR